MVGRRRRFVKCNLLVRTLTADAARQPQPLPLQPCRSRAVVPASLPGICRMVPGVFGRASRPRAEGAIPEQE